jgi:hypothetical protein
MSEDDMAKIANTDDILKALGIDEPRTVTRELVE